MRAFIIVLSLLCLFSVLLAPCMYAQDIKMEDLFETVVHEGDVQLFEVEGGSGGDIGISEMGQESSIDVKIAKDTLSQPQTKKPSPIRKILPRKYFRFSLQKRCRLLPRFKSMTIRSKCTCCERYCNCIDINRALKRGDSRYIPSDLEVCEADKKYCEGINKWGRSACGSCKRPWFAVRDPFPGSHPSKRTDSVLRKVESNGRKLRQPQSKPDDLIPKSKEPDLQKLSHPNDGQCMCNFPY